MELPKFGFFLLRVFTLTVESMNSFLVYSSCGQPQNDFDSLLDAKGEYSCIWLAEESFKVNLKCRCTSWLLQFLLIICQRTGVPVCPEHEAKTKPLMLCQRERALLKKLKSLSLIQRSSEVPLFLKEKPEPDVAEELYSSSLSCGPISPAQTSLAHRCQRRACCILER